MQNNLTSSAGWVCPACDRRIPSKVNECRCGYVRESASTGEAVAAEPSGTPPGVRPATVIVVALIAIAGTVWYMKPAPRSSPLQTLAAPTASRDAGPTLAAPAVAEPGSAPADAPAPMIRPSEASPVHTAEGAAPASLEDVIGRVMPAVVRVETGAGTGSGFFVEADTLLTNVHVVGSNGSVTIRRAGGTTAVARVAATAPDFDIAVLKISNPLPDQVTIPLGSLAGTRTGQEVIAIGSAFGMLQNTVTRGIVSGVRRVGAAQLVQTDAALNPGNSGGPLLDRTGTAIGINTASFRQSQGLNFAVSIDHARALLDGSPQAPPAAATSAEPSLRALNPAVPSPADQNRMQATRAYEQLLGQVARKADGLDQAWRTFRKSCYEGAVVGTFDHEWFALWEPRAMQGAVSPGCGVYFGDIKTQANEIRNMALAAEEAARQADIYPGVRRDLRRKYRLDYAGWDR
jgi:S1-C subfamily serine protease